MDMFVELKSKIKDKGIRIAFPEADDARVLGAAVRLKTDDLVEPVLIGNVEKVTALAKEHRWDLEDMQILDPHNYP